LYITQPYDDALHYILHNGKCRRNRTGIDCLVVNDYVARYRIDERFPLLTKRKLFPKSVFAELIWMLSGSTNNEDLKALGCNFWTPWVDPENPKNKAFYDATGFPAGYLGPVYGFQMRHFGKDYRAVIQGEIHRDEYHNGVDQISWLVDEIKANPESRRLIVSLWNPVDLPYMRLPPCHFAFHVLIDDDRRMSLTLNQRSADVFIGVPANIQFYSALCMILAQQTDCTPYEFIHHTEDTHIYMDHIDAVSQYLSREQRPSPKLNIKKADSIFNYKVDNFLIEEYDPHPTIKAPIAI
jgi:thymidylate synthase